MKKKIVTVVGARPQFIKAAPVSRVLRTAFEEVLVHTGQHYDHKMSDVFFDELNIPKPDYYLEVGSATHGKQTAMMLEKIEEVLLQEKPDAVLVYGDTNSTLAGALAASKLHIPIIHVEAGLRSFNKKMPEELNRVLTDHVSSLLFAPTQTAVANLHREGIDQNVFYVGDVMFDAVLYNVKLAEERHGLDAFGVAPKQYALATIHRAENTDHPDRLQAIFESLVTVEQHVLMPLHPRTEAKLRQFGLGDYLQSKKVSVIPPVSYLEMLLLEKHASYIITDSGGVQKEAYFMQVPCYTLRSETEWIETVGAGWNVLVNPYNENLAEIMSARVSKPYIPDLFGDGKASEKIVRITNSLL